MLDLPESETGFQIMLVFQRFICVKQNNDTEIMESCPFMFQSDSKWLHCEKSCTQVHNRFHRAENPICHSAVAYTK